MTVDATVVVAVVLQHLGKVASGIGQIFDMECNVLDNHSSAQRTGTCHHREHAGADCPIFGVFFRVGGKLGLHIEIEAFKHLFHRCHIGCELLFGVG